MFRWLALLLREKLEVYYRRINERSQRVAAHSKTKPFRPTVKLGLEGLEDRVVPSVAATVPPPAVPSVASIVSPPEIPVVTAAATLYNDAIKTVETAISTYQHLGDTIRARLEAALHHHHTITPFLPPAAPPQMTIWTWTPTQAGNLASDPRNWLLNGNPQGKNGSLPNGPDSEALFEGNDPIVWDTNLVFAQMALGRTNGAAYTGQQTIKANVIVEMTGGPNIPAMVQNVTGNVLSVYFDDATSVFQIDANATTSNVVLNGNPKGTFNIAGGTTTFAPSGAFEDNIGASIVVGTNGILNDLSFNPLVFTNANLALTIKGEMDVSARGSTLIKPASLVTGCYIDVAGGTLKYLGKAAVTDTFAVPVVVESIGEFSVTTANNGTNGKLIVQGGVTQTNGNSVYVKDNGVVNLSSSVTLECDSDYYQASGWLQTDSTTCTLQDGPNGALGTATIAGGKLVIAHSGGYNQLNVNCSQLNFAGTYVTSIAGGSGNPGLCDNLNVGGQIDLKGSSLSVNVNGTVAPTDLFIIIQASNILNNFTLPIVSYPQTNLTGKPNAPKPGQYQLT